MRQTSSLDRPVVSSVRDSDVPAPKPGSRTLEGVQEKIAQWAEELVDSFLKNKPEFSGTLKIEFNDRNLPNAYKFGTDLTVDVVATIYIDTTKRPGVVYTKRENFRRADCTVTLTTNLFDQIVEGKKKATNAWVNRDMIISGDVGIFFEAFNILQPILRKSKDEAAVESK